MWIVNSEDCSVRLAQYKGDGSTHDIASVTAVHALPVCPHHPHSRRPARARVGTPTVWVYQCVVVLCINDMMGQEAVQVALLTMKFVVMFQ